MIASPKPFPRVGPPWSCGQTFIFHLFIHTSIFELQLKNKISYHEIKPSIFKGCYMTRIKHFSRITWEASKLSHLRARSPSAWRRNLTACYSSPKKSISYICLKSNLIFGGRIVSKAPLVNRTGNEMFRSWKEFKLIDLPTAKPEPSWEILVSDHILSIIMILKYLTWGERSISAITASSVIENSLGPCIIRSSSSS